jgi:hypothetical protein
MNKLFSSIFLAALASVASAVTPTPGNYHAQVLSHTTDCGDVSAMPVKDNDIIKKVAADSFDVMEVVQFQGKSYNYTCQFNSADGTFNCPEINNDFDFNPTYNAILHNPYSSAGQWTSDMSYSITKVSKLECEGTDCATVAQFFGPTFQFPCGGSTEMIFSRGPSAHR